MSINVNELGKMQMKTRRKGTNSRIKTKRITQGFKGFNALSCARAIRAVKDIKRMFREYISSVTKVSRLGPASQMRTPATFLSLVTFLSWWHYQVFLPENVEKKGRLRHLPDSHL